VKQPIRYFFSQSYQPKVCMLLGVIAVVLGCAKIAGIDEMPVDPNAANGSPLCNKYCDVVTAGCPDCEVGTAGCVTPAYVYATRDMCMGVCHQLEITGKTGDPKDQTGNTIYCRLYQAQQALSTRETGTCQAAGPGGNSVCGTDCEDYCVLMQATCPTQFADPKYLLGDSLSTCIAFCAGLPVLDGGFNADIKAGYNIECRLYHISAANASQDARATHCPHAAGESPCNPP
jgi:hypothetical protein